MNVTLTMILVFLVGVSLYSGRRVKSQEEFAVAGRNLPTMVVFLTMLATWYGLSKLSDEFLSVTLYAYTIYGAALTPSLVAAMVWRRATAAAAVSSILGGTAMTLFWEISGTATRTGIGTIFPAIITSVLLLVVVSLMTPRQSEEKLLQIFRKTPEALS